MTFILRFKINLSIKGPLKEFKLKMYLQVTRVEGIKVGIVMAGSGKLIPSMSKHELNQRQKSFFWNIEEHSKFVCYFMHVKSGFWATFKPQTHCTIIGVMNLGAQEPHLSLKGQI